MQPIAIRTGQGNCLEQLQFRVRGCTVVPCGRKSKDYFAQPGSRTGYSMFRMHLISAGSSGRTGEAGRRGAGSRQSGHMENDLANSGSAHRTPRPRPNSPVAGEEKSHVT